jgi:transposase
VQLVNTAAVKQYDGLKHAGDFSDAHHLAHLMRLGILPTGHIYPREGRALRDLLRKRGQLVRQRTTQILSMQNRWHAIWGRNTAATTSNAGKQPTSTPWHCCRNRNWRSRAT